MIPSSFKTLTAGDNSKPNAPFGPDRLSGSYAVYTVNGKPVETPVNNPDLNNRHVTCFTDTHNTEMINLMFDGEARQLSEKYNVDFSPRMFVKEVDSFKHLFRKLAAVNVVRKANCANTVKKTANMASGDAVGTIPFVAAPISSLLPNYDELNNATKHMMSTLENLLSLDQNHSQNDHASVELNNNKNETSPTIDKFENLSLKADN